MYEAVSLAEALKLTPLDYQVAIIDFNDKKSGMFCTTNNGLTLVYQYHQKTL